MGSGLFLIRGFSLFGPAYFYILSFEENYWYPAHNALLTKGWILEMLNRRAFMKPVPKPNTCWLIMYRSIIHTPSGPRYIFFCIKYGLCMFYQSLFYTGLEYFQRWWALTYLEIFDKLSHWLKLCLESVKNSMKTVAKNVEIITELEYNFHITLN